MVLGFVLRCWGIGFGLPGIRARPDEEFVVPIAVGFFSGDLNPHTFFYGTLYMYILFFIYLVQHAFLSLFRVERHFIDVFTNLYLWPSRFYLTARFLSAGVGALTIGVVHRLGERLFDRRVALLAAVFMSVAYLPVRESHFGVTDTFLAFLLTSSIYFLAKFQDEPRDRNGFVAEFLAGLAASVKYVGVLVPVSVMIARYQSGARTLKEFFGRELVFHAGAFLLGFLAGCPFALINPWMFAETLLAYARAFSPAAAGWRESGWWYYLHTALFFGIGWPLLAASVFGAFAAFAEKRRKALAIFSFPALFFLLAGRGKIIFPRYALSLVPFVTILSAVAVVRAAARVPVRFRTAVSVVAAALLALPTLTDVVRWDRLMTKKDSRLLAMEWFQARVAPGASVFQACSPWGQVPLRPTVELLEASYRRTIVLGGTGKRTRAIIDRMKMDNLPAYDLWEWDGPGGTFRSYAGEKAGLPDCIVLEESPRGLKSPPVARLLNSDYVLAATFSGLPPDDGSRVYTPQDAFYVPFHGFSGVERPGPTLSIFQRKDRLSRGGNFPTGNRPGFPEL
jgi:hypothetical protein